MGWDREEMRGIIKGKKREKERQKKGRLEKLNEEMREI